MKVVGPSSIPSSFRVGLTLIIVLMVISSPILIFLNPISISAKGNNIDTSGQHSAFSLEDTTSSNPQLSSTPTNVSPMDSDFTTQAALSLTRASQTNNFVASKAYYDISFRTTTAGVIKTVEMDFPAGTVVGSANFVEATGIGPGTLLASPGEILRYTVTNEVNVAANTIIRIQISNINNPPTPSSSLTVSITTRNPSNTPIDGPTPTFAYNMVQVGNAQIAPGAVTTTKIANGAVTSGDIANGAVTGNKIAGIQKLLFAQCTLPTGSGSIAAGDTGFIDCSVSGAQIGDLVTGEYLGLSSGNQFSDNLLVVGMRVINVDSVTLFIKNTNDVSELDLDDQQFSLIVFRK